MKNWFKKTPEKKPKEQMEAEESERGHNISSLYEIVEDHLRSLDYDQLKSISGNFAERFATHQEIVSEIVRTPPSRDGGDASAADRDTDGTEEPVIIDTRRPEEADIDVDTAVEPYSNEIILSHYDRMIRSQYDRLVDVTMDFLKGVTETEVRRLDTKTDEIASSVEGMRDVLTGQVKRLGQDLDETREVYRGYITALEESIIEHDRKILLSLRRIKILVFAVIGAGLVGGAALVLSIIR